jgi:hypothetical protein
MILRARYPMAVTNRLGQYLSAAMCAGTQSLGLLSVTGFPVSPCLRLAEFTVPG